MCTPCLCLLVSWSAIFPRFSWGTNTFYFLTCVCRLLSFTVFVFCLVLTQHAIRPFFFCHSSRFAFLPPPRNTDVFAEDFGAPEEDGEEGTATIGRVQQQGSAKGKGQPRYPLPLNGVGFIWLSSRVEPSRVSYCKCAGSTACCMEKYEKICQGLCPER